MLSLRSRDPTDKKILEEVINYMLQSENTYIYESSIKTVYEYSKKIQKNDFVNELIEFICDELIHLEDTVDTVKDEDAAMKLVTKYTHFIHS